MDRMKMKKYLPPLIALALVIAAAAVVLLPAKPAPAGDLAPRDEHGDVVIRASELSTDQVTFLRFAEDSKVELIARLGEDGTAKVSLGTCQSCSGAPGAYYTQSGSELKCNNCGLTFPLDVVGVSGAGCHPILLSPEVVTETAEGLVISAAALRACEPLFAAVEEH